jgi:hypothetical protein
MAGFTWPDGSKGHSISWATELAHRAAAQAQRQQAANQAKQNATGLQPSGAPIKGVPRPGGTVPGAAGQAVAAAAGSSTSPMGTTPAALPVNPALDAIIGSIISGRESTISGLEAQKPQVLADYGYKASGYDSAGNPLGLSFDASNPYSRAALLKRNYDQQQTGTVNSMASRGQLYSGALQNAKASNEHGYNVADNALIQALTRLLVGIAGREQSTRTGAETQIAQARGQSMPTT